MAKRKCWYNNIKAGDIVEVKFLKGYWRFGKPNELVRIICVFNDGTFGGRNSNGDSIPMGFERTEWEHEYPVNIIRKVKHGA